MTFIAFRGAIAHRLIVTLSLSAIAAMSSLGGCATDTSIQNHARQFNDRLISSRAAHVRHPKVQEYVDELADLVRQAARERQVDIAPEDEWIFDKFDAVVVLDSQMNAAVSGDDVVRVHSGLLHTLERPEQVVAILTHEFCHNELRHMRADLNKRNANILLGIASIAGAAVGGNAGNAASAGASGAIVVNELAHRGFSRQDELEADAAGLDLFLRMGFDAADFRHPFEIMREKYGDDGGGTHPRNSDRIQQVNRIVDEKAQGSRSKMIQKHGWRDASYSQSPPALSLERFREIQRLVQFEESSLLKGRKTALESGLLKGFKSCFTYNYAKPNK